MQVVSEVYSDYTGFQNWLNLDWENLTWQGRYEKEFQKFWELLCPETSSFSEISLKLDSLKKQIKAGPLYSWLLWLEEKFIFYTFIKKNASISELAKQSQKPVNHVALILRNFFIDLFPHLEDYYNLRFQVGNILSPNINLRFSEIESDVKIPANRIVGGHDDEIMRSLEVTLYPEWKQVLSIIEDKSSSRFLKLNKMNFNQQIKFIQEILILFIIGWLVVFLVTKINSWYELKMADKISIYQPDFIRLNKSLIFKETLPPAELQLQIKELEEFTKQEKTDTPLNVEERLDTESEGNFASFEELPRNLEESQEEVNALEEIRKQNLIYRDGVSGINKVYRVMFTSVDTVATSTFIAPLLKKYKINSSSKLKQTGVVPGGIYYDLFVPSENLKKFLVKIASRGDVDIFESRTKYATMPGKNKVFIWVKEI